MLIGTESKQSLGLGSKLVRALQGWFVRALCALDFITPGMQLSLSPRSREGTCHLESYFLHLERQTLVTDNCTSRFCCFSSDFNSKQSTCYLGSWGGLPWTPTVLSAQSLPLYFKVHTQLHTHFPT